jgi:N-acetylglucosaminyl-diphospho-decaprenol L-rhamnosyltransferase
LEGPASSKPPPMAQTDAPLLSIVLVNSDGAAFTLACIASIYRFPPQAPFEVILVDNQSREPCLEPVAAQFPAVRCVSAPRRQGFAKNYNLGIRHARGRYVLILNNDTVVHAWALQALLDAAQRSGPTMLGARLESPDGTVQFDCARPLPTLRSYLLDTFLSDIAAPLAPLVRRRRARQADTRASGPVPCIAGACMLLGQELLAQIGPLDEGYDFYFEDVEWCHRALRYGANVHYVAEARITHYGDQSLSKVRAWAKRSEYRSAVRYFREYHAATDGELRLLHAATALSFLARGIAFLLLEAASGRTGQARAYLMLWHWLLGERPARGAGGPP